MSDGPAEPILSVSALGLSFGGLVALDELAFAVSRGEAVGLVGPNGAGKSSLLNCINGFYRPQRGSIRLYADRGYELTRLPPHRIAGLGVARTFQSIDLFRGMTVLENVLMGRHLRMEADLLTGGLWFGKARAEERRNGEVAGEVLSRMGLGGIAGVRASQLGVGTQKLVEFARALASEPRLVLLDEPVAGLSHQERGRIAAAIRAIHRDAGITLVVIEHDMTFVRQVCDRLIVLNFGQKIADGPTDAVLEAPAVIEAFLGGVVSEETAPLPASRQA
jgi:branched-chain amino acid transport system ATP-binding protein